MKHLLTTMIFATLLFFASCSKEEKKHFVDNTPAIAVKINTISEDGNNPYLTVSGKIEAEKTAKLSTRMMGFITKVKARVGQKVKKGQLLVSINNADLRAKRAQVNAGISEATAAFENAKKDYNRFSALFQDNSASQKELDDVTAHYNMAKARLESAKQMKNEINSQFSYTNIKAPFSGVVTNKYVSAGDMANPGMPLLEVESPGNFQVIAMVPESEISQIKQGVKVRVLVKSLGQTIEGKVTEISSSAKNTGSQYLVKIRLKKTAQKILSGMFVAVQFPIEKTKATSNIVLVSTKALVHRGQLTGVYTISQNNTALLRWLRLGRKYENQVEVLAGLTADEKYIISSEGKLYNGAKINIQ